MELETNVVDGVTVVKPRESRIDAVAAPRFKGALVDLINAGVYDLVLDFSGVEFIDSSGLAAMISTLKTIGERGALALAAMQTPVNNVFKVTRLNRVFDIHPDVEQAAASVRRRSSG